MTQSAIDSRRDQASRGPFNQESTLKPWPTKQQLLASIPEHLTEKNVGKAWRSLAFSLLTSLAAYSVGGIIPLQWSAAPLWIAYAVVTGTLATGCWVLAHECGHNAFHPNQTVENFIGFTLHSLLLVPYFSWQRSHAVHHANCNHLEAGETHVPALQDSRWATFSIALKRFLGPSFYAVVSLAIHLLVGWPLYLLIGVSSGPDYGQPTSHFTTIPPFNSGIRKLFPGKWIGLMRTSNLGIIGVLALLALAMINTSIARVLCVYGLPYLIVNAWLVSYTWLQHTDPAIPHFSTEDWDWAKGALQTVDRPYGPLLNLLHHGIGSTHVAHHLNSRIPHYNAWNATELIRSQFPEHIRYDPTPIHKALWDVALHCSFVGNKQDNGAYYYS
jgi:omega-6 fatty acid desaturase (delta-12 desaturase)